MKNYRLKKEAVPFFKSGMETRVLTMDVWRSCNIDEKALEIVEDCYVSFGTQGEKFNTLSGWSAEGGARFNFAIHFPSMKIKEYDFFSKGKLTRELMNSIQHEINRFYLNFNNEEKE